MLSIAEEQPQEAPSLSIDTGIQEVRPVAQDVADYRANKAVIGLASLNKPYDEVYTNIMSGLEDKYRQQVSSELDVNKQQAANDTILQTVRAKSTPLTDAEFNQVMTNTAVKPTDPKSVLEETFGKEFARQSLRRAVTWNEGALGEFEAIKPSNPSYFDRFTALTGNLTSFRDYSIKKGMDATNEIKGQDWVSYLADQAKMFFQAYTEYKLRGNVEGAGFFGGGPLGEALLRQRQFILRSPDLETFKTRFDPVFEYLRKDNPTLAAKWAASIAGSTTDERMLDNLFTPLMIFDIPFAGVMTKAAVTKALGRAKNISTNTIKTLDSEVYGPPSPATIARAAGDYAETAVQTVSKSVLDEVKGKSNTYQEARDALTTFSKLDAKDVIANPGRSGQELANQIGAAILSGADNLLDRLTNALKVSRTAGDLEKATPEQIRAVKDEVLSRHKNMDDRILDVTGPEYNPLSKTWSVDLKVGQRGAMLHFDEETAYLDAQLMRLEKGSYTVEPEGSGFYLRLKGRPINEEAPAWRALGINTAETQDPDSYLKLALGWTRGLNPEEMLSLDQRMQRKVASYVPSAIMEAFKAEFLTIKNLARGVTEVDVATGKLLNERRLGMKKRWDDWMSIVKLGRSMTDAEGRPGYFFSSPAELEMHYDMLIHRQPTQAEVAAYFAYKRMVESDRILRDLSDVRNKLRLGTESHTIITKDAKGVPQQSPAFEGTIVTRLPNGDNTVADFRAPHGETKMYVANNVPTKVYNEWRKSLKEGKIQIVKVFNTEERPFEGFSNISYTNNNTKVAYVITDNIASNPIGFNQLGRRGGGHFEYDHPFYIKQAKFRAEYTGDKLRDIYEGDTTLFGITIRKMGENVSERINKTLTFLANGKEEAAKAFAKDNLPFPYSELKAATQAQKDMKTGRLHPPRLSLELNKGKKGEQSLKHPIEVVEKDKLIADKDNSLSKRYEYIDKDGHAKTTYVDGTTQGNPARQQQVAFTGQRDAYELMTFNDYGSRHRPIFAYEPARMVDPIESINRSLTKIVHSYFLDDYKMTAVKDWLAKAAPYIKDPHVPGPEELADNPFYWFHKGKLSGEDNVAIRNLNVTNWQIRQFLGISNPVDQGIKNLTQKAIDNVYGKYGPKAVAVMPDWLLSSITDPVAFVKQIPYHANLGLFNWVQWAVQNQTWALIGSLSPRQTPAAVYGTMLYSWYRMGGSSPKLLAELDRYASKLRIPGMTNWKLGQFKEAMEQLDRTGFYNVQGEHAFVDSQVSKKVVQSVLGELLDVGTLFFKGGEKSVRVGAYLASMLEHRAAKPLGRISDDEARKVLNRADDLYGNMSRASSDITSSGVFSVTTQFTSYQKRISELFLGSRTSKADKAMMLAVYSTLYGVPVGIGVSAIPASSYIRKYAIENGYVVGDNWLTSLLMEGAPALMGAYATGKGDIKEGTFFNVGERYGSPGVEWIKDALAADERWWEIIGGPAYSKFAGIIGGAYPFAKAMSSFMKDDGESFPATIDDMNDVLKEISSYNNAWRTAALINTGRLMSKKGVLLQSDVSVGKSIFMSLTGLQDQKVNDMFTKSQSGKAFKELEEWGTNKAVEYFRKGLTVAKDDPEQGQKFFTRARTILSESGVRDDKIPGIMSRASEGYNDLIKSIDWNYYVKRAPKGKERTFMDAWGRTQNIEEKRRGPNITIEPKGQP